MNPIHIYVIIILVFISFSTYAQSLSPLHIKDNPSANKPIVISLNEEEIIIKQQQYKNKYIDQSDDMPLEGHYNIFKRDTLQKVDTIYGYKQGRFIQGGYKTGKWLDECYDVKRCLVTITTYRNGLRNGYYTVYDTNYHILYKSLFRKGTGYFKSFYPNMNAEQEGYYRNNLKEGLWKYYNENGKIVARKMYKKGSLSTILN